MGAYSLMGAMLGRAYLHIYVFSCLCIIIMEAGSGNPLSMDVWVEGNNWGGLREAETVAVSRDVEEEE